MKKKYLRFGLVTTFCLSLLLAFQNCSGGGVGSTASTAGGSGGVGGGGLVIPTTCPQSSNPRPNITNLTPSNTTFRIGQGADSGTEGPKDISLSFNSGDNFSAIVDIDCNVTNNQNLNVTCNAPNNPAQSGTVDLRIAADNDAECESGTVSVSVTVQDAIVNAQNSPIGACSNLQQTSAARTFTVNVQNACLATQRVNPAPGYMTGQMGNVVAIDETRAVATAPRDEDIVADGGAAYVMTRSGANWSITDKLYPSNLAAGDNLTAAAISGNTIVLGAPFANNFIGRAWVFQFDGANWNEVSQLEPPANQGAFYFGAALAISGGNVAVGAPLSNAETGAVYIYNAANGALVTSLGPSGANIAQGSFGYSLAYSGNTLAVGAPSPNAFVNRNESVYVFVNNVLQRRITQAAGMFYRFGYSVSLDGNNLAVGAPYFGDSEGRAYLYRAVNGQFPAAATLTYEMNDPNNDDVDRFGTSVTVKGGRVLASAPDKAEGQPKFGAVYLYNTTVNTQQFKIRAPAGDRGSDSFGHSIGVSTDGWLISGALNDEVVGGADNAGAVYFVDLP